MEGMPISGDFGACRPEYAGDQSRPRTRRNPYAATKNRKEREVTWKKRLAGLHRELTFQVQVDATQGDVLSDGQARQVNDVASGKE
jgi:hypothetical protein